MKKIVIVVTMVFVASIVLLSNFSFAAKLPCKTFLDKICLGGEQCEEENVTFCQLAFYKNGDIDVTAIKKVNDKYSGLNGRLVKYRGRISSKKKKGILKSSVVLLGEIRKSKDVKRSDLKEFGYNVFKRECVGSFEDLSRKTQKRIEEAFSSE